MFHHVSFPCCKTPSNSQLPHHSEIPCWRTCTCTGVAELWCRSARLNCVSYTIPWNGLWKSQKWYKLRVWCSPSCYPFHLELILSVLYSGKVLFASLWIVQQCTACLEQAEVWVLFFRPLCPSDTSQTSAWLKVSVTFTTAQQSWSKWIFWNTEQGKKRLYVIFLKR